MTEEGVGGGGGVVKGAPSASIDASLVAEGITDVKDSGARKI